MPEATVITPDERTAAAEHKETETALESLASICTVLAVGLFVMTFIFQNFEIPSGSMEKTLLIGDHVLVDRISFALPSRWFPLDHGAAALRLRCPVHHEGSPSTMSASRIESPSTLIRNVAALLSIKKSRRSSGVSR